MGLFLLLALFSAALVYITDQNAEIARSLASKSLESTALALSTAAENALRRYGSDQEQQIRESLSDRVVAYALIAGQDGTILFHTNPERVGTRLTKEEMGVWLPGSVSSRQVKLGTGIPAYEFDFTLRRPDGSDELLRLSSTRHRRTWSCPGRNGCGGSSDLSCFSSGLWGFSSSGR